jgi:hypothetical protein
MTDVANLLDEVGLFRDKFGNAIERDNTAWLHHSMRVNRPYRFDFAFLADFEASDAIAFVLYVRHQLQVNGIEHSKNAFSKIKQFLESDSYKDDGEFLTAFRNHRRDLRNRSLEYALHYTKDWYLWRPINRWTDSTT